MADKFFQATTIEQLAYQLLTSYQQKAGRPLTLPLSAESILDIALSDELGSVLWDVINEAPGHTILAGLAPADRLIILNEQRQQLFQETPGLLNTTVAHEIGHWILHVDQALIGHPTLPGIERVLTFTCEPKNSRSWDEKNAHRFMGYLLMPINLLAPVLEQSDLSCWPGLYALRKQLNVTITALKIRLEELGLVYVDRDGVFHRSRPEAAGQQRLF